MRIVLIVFSLFIGFACIRSKKIPEGILSQQEMHKVLWDLMRADAYVTDFLLKDSSKNKKQESAILYEKIFAIHAISREAFQKSLTFYESRPDLMKIITDSLRSNEKRVMNYEHYKKPEADTTLRKMKISKKVLDKKLEQTKQ